MALQAKSTKSIVKQSLNNSKVNNTGVKKILFAHKSPGSETSVDVTALVTPSASDMPGFTQPGLAEIQNARMNLFRKNLRIISSDKGALQDYLDYSVASSTVINFNFTTVLDEIFHFYLEPVVKSGTLVADIDTLLVTGTLTAGTADINLGKAQDIINLTDQIGAVQVFVAGQLFLRNVSNATAAPAADGEYEEVDNGQSQFTIVRLNNTFGSDQPYVVVSTALTTIRPDGSFADELESQQGVIDLLVATTALLAGVPETNFQATPTQPQLTQYGNRVTALERYRAVLDSSPTATRTGTSPTDRILFNTAAGVGSIVLPLTPSVGDWVELWDGASAFATNTATVDRNGNLIEGAAANFTISTDDVKLKFVYSGSTLGWIIGTLS